MRAASPTLLHYGRCRCCCGIVFEAMIHKPNVLEARADVVNTKLALVCKSRFWCGTVEAATANSSLFYRAGSNLLRRAIWTPDPRTLCVAGRRNDWE